MLGWKSGIAQRLACRFQERSQVFRQSLAEEAQLVYMPAHAQFRADALQGGVNLVEIPLLRAGQQRAGYQ